MKYALLWICFGMMCQLGAQGKYEKESRTSTDKVPQKAVIFVQKLPLKKKIKWYKEQQLDTISFEAKTKHKGSLYSIEFAADGSLEDVEVLVPWRKLPKGLQNTITSHLERNFKKYTIVKVQKQFKGNDKQILNWFLKEGKGPNLAWELVVRTKKTQWEYLFDGEGKFLHKEIFVQLATDHLDF
ncbi:MAG: hypothetical protein OIF50_01830 [Flavobacteriaceae bacterium]|nr:hypothetical protein [Flavobacteriaceae bacterium]